MDRYKMRTRKKAGLAALLNLFPLAGVIVGLPIVFPYLPNQYAIFGILIYLAPLGVGVIVWGIGYLYLGRMNRFAVALVFPFLYAFGYLLFPKPVANNYPDFYFPYLYEAFLIFGFLNLLSGIDAWFLASRPGNRRSGTLDKRGLKISRTDPDYVICPSCGTEQWKRYTECQKCGAHFS